MNRTELLELKESEERMKSVLPIIYCVVCASEIMKLLDEVEE